MRGQMSGLGVVGLPENNRKNVGNGSHLDNDLAIHVRFAEAKLGIDQHADFAARLVKRMAAGLPEPSPKANVDPLAVVTRRLPPQISFSSAH